MLHLIKYRYYVLRRIIPFAKGVKRHFIINIFLSIVLITADFIVPILYKEFIEETIIAGRINTFIPIVLGYILIHLNVTGVQYIKNYNNNKIRNRVSFQVKFKMWNNLFRVKFSNYDHFSIGDIKMHLEDDVTALANFSSNYTIDYLIHFITMVVCICIMFVMEWRLALFSVTCIPITFSIDYILSKREMMLNNEQRNNDQSMNSWLYNSLNGWKEIKALNLENRQKLIYMQYIKKYALYYAKWINYWTLRALIIPMIRNEFCMKFGLYFIGGLLIMNGKMSIGNLLVFAIYFELLMNAIMNVSSIDSDLQGKKTYIDRLFDVLSKEYPKDEGMKLPEITSISLKDIHYGYTAQEEILHGVNIDIQKGDCIAFVGKSGCGKTTLLKVLVGMLDSNHGSIHYSGVNLASLRLSSIHKKIGFIMQSNHLYNISIKENLLLGNSKATQDDMIEACKKACILDYIMGLPYGFETLIGEGGSKLSGGQRQRIVLARTFLRDVDVFIFDEATSALDQYSEKIINDAIANVGSDKIIIIVAHRESSIELCNRVIHLEEFCG